MMVSEVGGRTDSTLFEAGIAMVTRFGQCILYTESKPAK